MSTFDRTVRHARPLVAATLFALCLGTISPAGAQPPDASKAEGSRTVPLTRIRTGHLMVRATVNGRPLQLVVDTACPVTVISDAAYRTLDLPATGSSLPEGVRPLKSLSGQRTRTGYLPDLRIGAANAGGKRVAVAGLDAVLGSQFAGWTNAGANGILGTDVLAGHGAVIDLGRGTLSLDVSPDARRELAQRAARGGYTAIPLAATNGLHLAVACILQGDPERLVVDTGSPYTVMQRGVVPPGDLARPRRFSTMRTLGRVTTVAWVPLQHWNIGDFAVNRTTVGAGEFRGGIFAERTRNGGRVVGLLGLEWLAHWGAVIDCGSRTIYLKHP